MRRPRRPLFLARAPYRRRRLRDAARLLPILGLFLLLLPLLWAPTAQMTLTADDVIYFFAVWLCLIALAAAFAPGLRGGDGSDEDED
jgi:peptidoglycan/LPS O-acetylase OafA/YrhL